MRKKVPEWSRDLTDDLFDQLEQIEKQAQTKDRTLIEHALKTTLELPAVVSLVLGVKRLEQVESIMRAME